MNEQTRMQKGSPSRDEFKRRHKDLDKRFWGCDVDFVLIEKDPTPDIVAVLDYKAQYDDITFTEVIAYNAYLKRGIPVFIVQGDAETGAFEISRYAGGHHKKPRYALIPHSTTSNWSDYGKWESALRERYKKRYGL